MYVYLIGNYKFFYLVLLLLGIYIYICVGEYRLYKICICMLIEKICYVNVVDFRNLIYIEKV